MDHSNRWRLWSHPILINPKSLGSDFGFAFSVKTLHYLETMKDGDDIFAALHLIIPRQFRNDAVEEIFQISKMKREKLLY